MTSARRVPAGSGFPDLGAAPRFRRSQRRDPELSRHAGQSAVRLKVVRRNIDRAYELSDVAALFESLRRHEGPGGQDSREVEVDREVERRGRKTVGAAGLRSPAARGADQRARQQGVEASVFLRDDTRPSRRSSARRAARRRRLRRQGKARAVTPVSSRVDAVLAGLPPADAALVRCYIDDLDPEGRRHRLARRDEALIEIVDLMRLGSETRRIADAAPADTSPACGRASATATRVARCEDVRRKLEGSRRGGLIMHFGWRSTNSARSRRSRSRF